MTETLMNTGVRASGERRPGYVGPPLDGVDVRLVDDDGNEIEDADDETIGEIHVRGPNLFLEYLNRPDATAEAMTDGWFKTGDLATRAPDGYIRIVGRRATDLIKSGGFKIGAGEIEGALLEHPGVKEAAVTGEPDPDLGERIVAWVVTAEGESPSRGRPVRPRRRHAHPAQAPARRALRRRAAAQRDGQGPEEAAGGAVKITGEHDFAAARDAVWNGLHDPQVLAATMPGAHRLDPTGPNEYVITVSVGVGSVKGTYDGVFAVTDTADGEACTVRATASGRPGLGRDRRADAADRRRRAARTWSTRRKPRSPVRSPASASA